MRLDTVIFHQGSRKRREAVQWQGTTLFAGLPIPLGKIPPPDVGIGVPPISGKLQPDELAPVRMLENEALAHSPPPLLSGCIIRAPGVRRK